MTLDLNGYTIGSTASSAMGTGILLGSGVSDITIANGHIRGGVTNNGSGVYGGSGFGYGIFYSGTPPRNVLVLRVSVSGCLYDGIRLATSFSTRYSTLVESCTARTVGSAGINANTAKQSAALDCGGNAITGFQVSDCRGESIGSGAGVYATTAQNCYGYSIGGGTGVSAVTAQNCYGYSSGSGSGYGVYATTAQNCYGTSGGYGVYAYTAQNCFGYGSSSYGVHANLSAIGCVGYSDAGIGLYAPIAAFCGGSRFGGRAIQATIANGCWALAGTNNITYKYNMP